MQEMPIEELPSVADRRMWKQWQKGDSISLVAKRNGVEIAAVKRCLRKVDEFMFSVALAEVAELRMQIANQTEQGNSLGADK